MSTKSPVPELRWAIEAAQNKKAADVTWDLVLSGNVSPGLAPAGTAILDGKVWKMSQLTVCNLFTLADPTLADSGPCADVLAKG